MKKLFNATIVLALSSMLFFSCSKSDDLVVKDENVLVKATLIAGNPQVDPGTKTEIQGTTPYWSVGDAIGVTNGFDSNSKFTTGITSASATATFDGETISGDLFAYYPYSTLGVSTSGASISLPAEQNPTATSFDGKADVLVSKGFTITPENTTVSGLTFKRLTAAVKVVFKDNTGGSLTGEHPTFVSLEAGSNLIGSVLVNFAGQSMSVQSGATKVTANYTASTQYAIDGTNGAYFVVFPQTLASGTTLTVKANTENYYIEKNITIPSSGIEILEGKITTLNIGLGAAHVTHHPVINVTSDNPMNVDNIADTYTINYSISDPLSGENISATTDAAWISNVTVSSTGINFDVAAQKNNAAERTGSITLSYKDANDVVVTVTQKKGRILATLAFNSSSTIAASYVDDKGNTWVYDSDAAHNIIYNSGSVYCLESGTNNDKSTHLSLTLSGKTYKIWEIHAWAAAAHGGGIPAAYTHISINGTNLVTSAALADNAGGGGTELSLVNNQSVTMTGDVEIAVRKEELKKGPLYFNKLIIIYDEN